MYARDFTATNWGIIATPKGYDRAGKILQREKGAQFAIIVIMSKA